MKPNTCLVIDVWEGNPDINETILLAAGVKGIGIRLNDMNGGHHLDENFYFQWEQSKGFVRFPYFVYNPWVDGKANFDWLIKYLPREAHSVAIDVEVRYPGYPANKYAGEVLKFLAMCKNIGLKTIIYTGQWFLPNLTIWPADADYWWAQYPDETKYFPGIYTWQDLFTAMDNPALAEPFNKAVIPGRLALWQFGEHFLLPGALGHFLDVSLFNGSAQDLADYFLSYPGVDEPPVVNPPVVDPPVVDPPVVEPTEKSGLYISSPLAHFRRPNDGPLVTQTYNITKTSSEKTVILRQNWITKLKDLTWNSAKMFAKIVAKDWGPSKGFTGNGDLILNALIYPGNVVHITKILTGIDGAKWGELEVLDANSIPGPGVNYKDRPDLVHTVYGYAPIGYATLANAPHVPLVSYTPRFIRMEWLLSVDAMLPKVIRVTNVFGVNIRETPSAAQGVKILGYKMFGQTVEIEAVRVAPGGIWGKLKGTPGWMAIRNNGSNFFDWKI